MPFVCDDCSHRGVKTGNLGECLACGSYNIRKRPYIYRDEKPLPKWRLALLAALWAYLIGAVAFKLVG